MKFTISLAFLVSASLACSGQSPSSESTATSSQESTGCPTATGCSNREQACYDEAVDAGDTYPYPCFIRYYTCQAAVDNCGGETYLGCLSLCDAQYERCEQRCSEPDAGPGCSNDCKNDSRPCSRACLAY